MDKGDAKRGINTVEIVKIKDLAKSAEKKKNIECKIKPQLNKMSKSFAIIKRKTYLLFKRSAGERSEMFLKNELQTVALIL